MGYKSKFKGAEIDVKLDAIYILSEELSAKMYNYELSSADIKKIVEDVFETTPMMWRRNIEYGLSNMYLLSFGSTYNTDINEYISKSVYCITPWYDEYEAEGNRFLHSGCCLSYDYTTGEGTYTELS